MDLMYRLIFLKGPKVFDRVDYTKLYELLLQKDICALECMVLIRRTSFSFFHMWH